MLITKGTLNLSVLGSRLNIEIAISGTHNTEVKGNASFGCNLVENSYHEFKKMKKEMKTMEASLLGAAKKTQSMSESNGPSKDDVEGVKEGEECQSSNGSHQGRFEDVSLLDDLLDSKSLEWDQHGNEASDYITGDDLRTLGLFHFRGR
ncbi:hypothetical protein Tco_1075255 [Tanacetum coccineum]